MKGFRLVLCLILLTIPLWATGAGKEWIYTGIAPSSLGVGYGGVANAQAGNLLLNPAAPALDSRFQVSSLYGASFSNQINLIQLSLPMVVGKFSAGYLALHNSEPNDISRFTLGFSRELLSGLAFGVSGYGLNWISDGKMDMGWGMDLGVLFKLPPSQKTGSPLLIDDHQFGLSVHGIGKPSLLNDGIALPSLGVRTGWRFRWLKIKGLKAFGEVDGQFDALPFNAFGSLSTRFEINRTIALYGGLTFGKGVENLGLWTAGGSILLNFGGTDVEVFYHLNPETINFTPEFLHSVGLELSWGSVDRTPPTVNLSFQEETISNESYPFSPNYDGARDRVCFKFKVKDASPIILWKMVVLNESGQAIRTVERKVLASGMKANELWKSLWSSVPEVVIPETLNWDGTDDSGKRVSDGIYLVFAQAMDVMRNIGFSVSNRVLLDTTPPLATLGLSEDLFSPDGDGSKDEVTVFQTLSSNDSWKAQIRDVSGKIIRSWEWKQNAPAELVWKGRNERGDLVPDGVYDYLVYGLDSAGNRTLMNIPGIRVNTTGYLVSVDVNPTAFSPKLGQQLDVNLRIPKTNGLKNWTLILKDNKEQSLREWKGGNSVSNLRWNGKDANGNALPDGLYYFRFGADFDSGAHPFENSRPVLLDQTPPSFEFGWAPDLFTPDGDGKNDELEFHFIASDEAGMDHWKIEVLDSRGTVFQSFEGSGYPATNVYWSGRSALGKSVESARSYPVRLSLFDVLGNGLTNLMMGDITAGILLEPGLRGWRVALPEIIFNVGENALSGEAFPVLNRLSEILTRFPDVQIELRGYGLSEETSPHQMAISRAEAVKAYLTGRGIAFRRLKTLDGGVIEDTDISNGRVEFVPQ